MIPEPSNGSWRLSFWKSKKRLNSRLAASETATRNLARSHYENFLVASALLPSRLHQPFFNIYAFCRTADDLADESESPAIALRRLEVLQADLDAVFQGCPRDGILVALADTIEQFQLPKQPFDDLLDAFRQDQRKLRYETFDDVHEYCRRSANPVGRIVLRLVNCDFEMLFPRSDSICTGLQLANFLQDVGGDFRRGRIYLPADQMERFEVRETMFALTSTPRPLRELLASECTRAEKFLCDGLPLAEQVPRWFAADVRLFAHGGLATIEAIRAINFDVLRVRPTVTKRKQFSLLLKAALRLL